MFPIHASNFINGEFIPNIERIPSIDPSNLDVLGSVPSATADDVNKAVEAAKMHFLTGQSFQIKKERLI